jgi:hypothetical protein
VAELPESARERRRYEPATRELLPELWTRERHPQWARARAIAQFLDISIPAVRQLGAKGRIRTIRLAPDIDIVLFDVSSAFDHVESRPVEMASSPPPIDAPRRRRGRPPGRRNSPKPDSAHNSAS